MLHGSVRSEPVGLHGFASAGASGEPAAQSGAPERRVYADGSWAAGMPRTEAAGHRTWERSDGRPSPEAD